MEMKRVGKPVEYYETECKAYRIYRSGKYDWRIFGRIGNRDHFQDIGSAETKKTAVLHIQNLIEQNLETKQQINGTLGVQCGGQSTDILENFLEESDFENDGTMVEAEYKEKAATIEDYFNEVVDSVDPLYLRTRDEAMMEDLEIEPVTVYKTPEGKLFDTLDMAIQNTKYARLKTCFNSLPYMYDRDGRRIEYAGFIKLASSTYDDSFWMNFYKEIKLIIQDKKDKENSCHEV